MKTNTSHWRIEMIRRGSRRRAGQRRLSRQPRLDLYQLGRYRRRSSSWRRPPSARTPTATVLDHLGDAQQKPARRIRPRDTWQRAAAAFRKEKDEEHAKQVEAKITAPHLRERVSLGATN